MKTLHSFLIGCSLTLTVHADDFTGRDGTVYKNYKVLGHDAGSITIMYEDGGGQIPLSNLPDAMQKQYGYDPAKAAAALKAADDAFRKDQAQVAAEAAAIAAQKKKANAALYSDTATPSATAGVAAKTALPQSTVFANEAKISDDQQAIDGLNTDLKVAEKDYAQDHTPSGALKVYIDRDGIKHAMHSGTSSEDRCSEISAQIDALNKEIADLQQQDAASAGAQASAK